MANTSVAQSLSWAALLMLLAAPAAASGEVPTVSAQANAPGWITVQWSHSGVDVYWYEIQRQDLSSVWNDYGASGTLTDAGLQANTTYHYRVCAIYLYDRVCSDWVSATTLPPPNAPPTGGSAPAPQTPVLHAPELTASSVHPLLIVVHWGSDQRSLLNNVLLYRDGALVYDVDANGDYVPEKTDLVPRANTEYTYTACFIGLHDESVCSAPLEVMPQAIAPTAPAAVVARVIHTTRPGSTRSSDTLKPGSLANPSEAYAEWQNGFIPGQFVSVERQDIFLLPGGSTSTTLRPTNRAPYWVELERSSAANDPTEMVFNFDQAPGTGSQKGSAYRVCAIEPRLGELGKVCSDAVTLQ